MTELIGGRVIRKDAFEKATGQANYVADIRVDDMCYGVVVRSSYHAAKLLRIDTTEANKVDGVLAVITADDVPGNINHGPLIQDQPALAHKIIRHKGEPVVLVIAKTKKAAA